MTGDAVVVVTGAAGGLGSAMTLGLLRAGRRVVALDVESSAQALESVRLAAAREGLDDRLFRVVASVRSASDAERAIAAAIERFGGVDALINNAGLGMETISPFAMQETVPFYEVPVERWQAAIDTNVNGPFIMARTIAPHLVRRGWGRIVNVVTSYPTMLKKGFSPYGPSKAAVEAATVAWSKDLDGTGVTVNALLPGGAADTAMVPREAVPDRSRLVKPEVMVAPAVWLTSTASDGLTGRRFVASDFDPHAEPMRAGWEGTAAPR